MKEEKREEVKGKGSEKRGSEGREDWMREERREKR